MSLRCVYTDLDGTLLGAGASLFTDEEGRFSMFQARALEACSRAGVEVVKTEHLYLFDGERGFSLGQGE